MLDKINYRLSECKFPFDFLVLHIMMVKTTVGFCWHDCFALACFLSNIRYQIFRLYVSHRRPLVCLCSGSGWPFYSSWQWPFVFYMYQISEQIIRPTVECSTCMWHLVSFLVLGPDSSESN